MATEINTHGDMLRHAAVQAGTACFLTLLMTPIFLAVQFGLDPTQLMTVGSAFSSALLTGGAVSAILAAILSYRSTILMRDLTMARKELFRLSRTDQLTGLLNRRGFDELAEAAILGSRQAGVLMCDIDNFKGVNDRFGHDFGDHVLVAIATVFRSFSEEEFGIVSRHGGEEFVLLLTGPAAQRIEFEAELLRRRCEIKVMNKGIPVPITVSIGFASSVEMDDFHQLMRAADDALFRAKRNGRNCAVGAQLQNCNKAA